jgi:phosphate transport system substrate-binding protein
LPSPRQLAIFVIMKRLVCALFALSAFGSAAGGTEKIRTIRVVGSSTVRTLMLEMASDFVKSHDVRVPVEDKGSSEGIACAKAKTCDLGIVSRSVDSMDSKQVRVTHLAWDGIAIVAHRGFPLDNLTFVQLKKVFSGQVKNWKEIGGPDTPAHIYTREQGRASTAILEAKLGFKIHGEAYGSNDSVLNRIQNIDNSMAYYSLGLAREAGPKVMKVLRVEGIEPSKETIDSGQYAFTRELVLVQPILAQPNADVDAFVEFIKSGSAPYLKKHGFTP